MINNEDFSNLVDLDDLELVDKPETTTVVTDKGDFIETPANSKNPAAIDSIDDFLNKTPAKIAEKQLTDLNGDKANLLDLDDLNDLNDLGTSTTTNKLIDNETKSYREFLKENFGDFITLENGEQLEIDSLNKNDLKEIISSIQEDEQETNVDETAELLLNAYNQEGIEGVIELLKANNLLNNQPEHTSDTIAQIKSMSKEDLLYFDAQNKCSECTAEELEEAVNSIKNSKSYNKVVEGIRQSLIQEEQSRLEVEAERAEFQRNQEIENIRKQVVQEVQNLPEILGIANNEEIMNEITPMLLNPSKEDPEYSVFVNHLLSDPLAQYKAAFFITYEKEIMSFIDEQIKEAEERGKRSIFGKLPTKPKTSINPDKRATTTKSAKEANIINIDDL